MKYRKSDWLGIKTLEKSYGIDAYFNGEWMHVSENGEPLFFKTAEERDARLKALRVENPEWPR